MIEETLLIKALGESPKLKTVMFFLENKIFDYPKIEVAKQTSVSRTTLNSFWDELIKWKIILKTRAVGKAVFYRINLDSPIVRQLIQLNRIICDSYEEIAVKKEVPVKVSV